MRESRRFVALIASVLALVAGNAQAQEKRVNVSFGAGYTAPNAEVRNHLGDGYNINFGLQVNLNRKIGIEGLYSFNGLGAKQISVGVSNPPGSATVPTDFSGDMNMQYGTADVVFQGEVANRTTAYVPRRRRRLLPADQSDDAGRRLRAAASAIPGGTSAIRAVSFPWKTSSDRAARRTSG